MKKILVAVGATVFSIMTVIAAPSTNTSTSKSQPYFHVYNGTNVKIKVSIGDFTNECWGQVVQPNTPAVYGPNEACRILPMPVTVLYWSDGYFQNQACSTKFVDLGKNWQLDVTVKNGNYTCTFKKI